MGGINFNPDYREQKLDKYIDNICIEVLENFEKNKILKHIQVKAIEIPKNFTGLSLEDQNDIVHELKNIIVPIKEHLDLYNKLSLIIREGYVKRSPFSKELVRLQNSFARLKSVDVVDEQSRIEAIKRMLLGESPPSLMVIGGSGMGKSTIMLKLLNLYDVCYIHTKIPAFFKDDNIDVKQPINLIQIPFIRVEIGEDTTIKSFLLELIKSITPYTGIEYSVGRSKAPNAILRDDFIRMALSCNLGLIIIDEMQNLVSSKSKSKNDDLVNFLATFMDTLHVPMVYIGTPECQVLFKEKFRFTRRIAKEGIINFDNVSEDSWNYFVKSLLEPINLINSRFTGKNKYNIYSTISKETVEFITIESNMNFLFFKQILFNSVNIALANESVNHMGRLIITKDIVKYVLKNYEYATNIIRLAQSGSRVTDLSINPLLEKYIIENKKKSE